MSRFQLVKNLTILGPPGSGKGFYGRLLAQKWNIRLITTSDVLRAHQHQPLDLDSGKLVECQQVSDLLQDYLCARRVQQQDQCYILDGFPRTLQQIELMTTQWPQHCQVHAALHLDIPDRVCIEKSLGRRVCNICWQFPNEANVQYDQFDLPPTRPKECRGRCDAEKDWSKRKDDTAEIIQERLFVHRQHEEPIIEYYRQRGALLQVTPYNGLKDVPMLAENCEKWLSSTAFRETTETE